MNVSLDRNNLGAMHRRPAPEHNFVHSVVHDGVSKFWGGGDPEEPKVAMYKHKWHAFLRCLIHVLPVAAALLLIGMNGTEYYIGGELAGWKDQDTEKLAGLAFTAKLHELLMLASITAVFFSYARKELAFGDGLLFGAVCAGRQITSISFLWSMEFFGSIYREWGKKRKKWNLISMVITCCVLGVSVGPSTNILMRPRLDDWPAGGTTFWLNATYDALFPSALNDSTSLAHCGTYTGDSSCPYGDWQILSQQYYRFWPGVVNLSSMPQEVFMPGRTAVRRMGIRYRAETRTETIWSNAYGSAWIGNSAVADALAQLGPYWSYAARNVDPGKRLIYRKDATFAVEAPMTEIFARCCAQAMNRSDLHSIPLPYPALGSGRLDGRPNTAANSIASFDTYSADWDAYTINSIRSLLQAGGAPNIIWLDSPALLNGSQSTLNAVVVFPETTSDQAYLHTCSIDSRLQPGVKLTGSWLNPSVITGYLSGTADTGTLGANSPKTYPTAVWARYLNPTIASQNRTLISVIA
ncbi:hypothetical protein LTR28_004363 [Elasticomyces elasticus]|nr:hypothetical protein LTR28_004363 [Elasticomyces elasticus]